MINNLTPRVSNPKPSQKSKGKAELKQQSTKLGRLRKLLDNRNQDSWAIGDLIVQLVEVHGFKRSDLADILNIRSKPLGDFYSTAKAFPLGVRNTKLPYNVHEITRVAADTTEREIAKFTRRDRITPNYGEALRKIEEGRTEENRPIQMQREATKFLIREARKNLIPNIAPQVKEWLEASTDIINKPHHCKGQDLAAMLGNGTVKLVNLDPPYGAYRKTDNGKCHIKDSAGLTTCDNEDETSAIRETCEVIQAIAPKLEKGGTILLWQASTTCLRLPILQVIEDLGLKVFNVVTWDKRRQQASDFAEAYTLRTEICYVIGKEMPLNHDDELSRKNIIDFAPVRQSITSLIEKHPYEKPLDMMEDFVAKLTNKGEIVADLFGCSGSMAIAAAKLGRKWVYSECQKDNFDFGAARIFEFLDKDSVTAD